LNLASNIFNRIHLASLVLVLLAITSYAQEGTIQVQKRANLEGVWNIHSKYPAGITGINARWVFVSDSVWYQISTNLNYTDNRDSLQDLVEFNNATYYGNWSISKDTVSIQVNVSANRRGVLWQYKIAIRPKFLLLDAIPSDNVDSRVIQLKLARDTTLTRYIAD